MLVFVGTVANRLVLDPIQPLVVPALVSAEVIVIIGIIGVTVLAPA